MTETIYESAPGVVPPSRKPTEEHPTGLKQKGPDYYKTRKDLEKKLLKMFQIIGASVHIVTPVRVQEWNWKTKRKEWRTVAGDINGHFDLIVTYKSVMYPFQVTSTVALANRSSTFYRHRKHLLEWPHDGAILALLEKDKTLKGHPWRAKYEIKKGKALIPVDIMDHMGVPKTGFNLKVFETLGKGLV